MDSEKVKPVLIGVTVVCLAASGVLMYRNFGGGGGTVSSTQPVPMICVACGHTSEIPFKEFQNLASKQMPDMRMMDPTAVPRFECPSCGQRGLQTGIKCPGCTAIFAADYARNPQLKCPKCGQSGMWFFGADECRWCRAMSAKTV